MYIRAHPLSRPRASRFRIPRTGYVAPTVGRNKREKTLQSRMYSKNQESITHAVEIAGETVETEAEGADCYQNPSRARSVATSLPKSCCAFDDGWYVSCQKQFVSQIEELSVNPNFCGLSSTWLNEANASQKYNLTCNPPPGLTGTSYYYYVTHIPWLNWGHMVQLTPQ